MNGAPIASTPSSTYRLQLNGAFRFADASAITDYLADLGIGACYVSPVLKARSGSPHGYDVVDHSTINPEIGDLDSLRGFVEGLRKRGMGLIVDVVPNHMCVADLSNAQWHDVLENGPSSPHARFFDIDWNPPREDLRHKVLLPILSDQYGRVLEGRQIRVEYASGAFVARIHDLQLPLAPKSWPLILDKVRERIRPAVDETDPCLLELESIITALGYLPLRTETDQERIRERQREKEIIRRRLAALTDNCEAVAQAIEASLMLLNGDENDPASFNDLEQLLSEQAFRLSFWRVAADEINYRRFFDINELAAIRTEDPAVFEATHWLIFDLVHKGWITGLRIDHPDGLFDPAQYFADLQAACRGALDDAAPRFFVIAEKIVASDEELRPNWAIEGTTGYGFLNQLNALFVYPGSRKALRSLYARWTGQDTPFTELAYASKRLILRASMSSELNVLARRLDRICQQHRHSRDFTLESLRFALREVISCFPVYRTYVTKSQTAPGQEDRRHIETAIREAKQRNPATSESVFDAIGSLLLLQDPLGITEEQRAERRLFVMRFQQLTGPVMAKGVEDTAFYRYYPLASLNEVGGDPDEFGIRPRDFHRKNNVRLQKWPRALLATSTHDTKRSEDARARINVLSEIPMKWYEAVRRWNHLNGSKRTGIDGVLAPDPNAEYLLYQTLVGVWPWTGLEEVAQAEFVQRIQDYMDKALKEAKQYTSWINPHQKYDQAVRDFIGAILVPIPENAFLRDFEEFVRPVAKAGMFNSLSQVVLKIACPGVPDFYQGSELWDFSLVDPDNRRPVDFETRRSYLTAILRAEKPAPELIAELLRTPEDGRIKLYVTRRCLCYRRSNRDLFESGAYHAIDVTGAGKQHVIALARKRRGKTVIAAAARFFLKLKPWDEAPAGPGVWEGTALQLTKTSRAAVYQDILSGEVIRPVRQNGSWTLPAADVFRRLPVAMLEAGEA